MFDTCEQTRDLALIEAIAAALREELGVAIEDHPGFHHPTRPARSTAPSGPWPAPSSGRASRRERTCRRS